MHINMLLLEAMTRGSNNLRKQKEKALICTLIALKNVTVILTVTCFLLVFKPLSSQTPSYISEYLTDYNPNRLSRSSNTGLLNILCLALKKKISS